MIPDEIRRLNLRLALLVRAGSKAYGIQVEESDDDAIGIFIAPLREIASMAGLAKETIVGTKPDFTLHEIAKFCRLALKGNPAVLETLWNEEILHADEWGRTLLKMRSKFLHRGSLQVYVDYARDQMKRMTRGSSLHSKGGAYNAKYGAHLIRLLHAGIHLAEKGEVLVRVPAPLARTLLSIRRGGLPMGEVLDRARPLLDRLAALTESNDLPEEPDARAIDDCVVRAHLSEA